MPLLWEREGRLALQGFQFEGYRSPGSAFSHPWQMSWAVPGGEALLLARVGVQLPDEPGCVSGICWGGERNCFPLVRENENKPWLYTQTCWIIDFNKSEEHLLFKFLILFNSSCCISLSHKNWKLVWVKSRGLRRLPHTESNCLSFREDRRKTSGFFYF